GQFQAEQSRNLRPRRERLGVVCGRLQGRYHWSGEGLGGVARRILGDKQSNRDAVFVSKRGGSKRPRRDLRLSVRARGAGAGEGRAVAIIRRRYVCFFRPSSSRSSIWICWISKSRLYWRRKR